MTIMRSRSRNNFPFFKRGGRSKDMMPFVSHQCIFKIYPTEAVSLHSEAMQIILIHNDIVNSKVCLGRSRAPIGLEK